MVYGTLEFGYASKVRIYNRFCRFYSNNLSKTKSRQRDEEIFDLLKEGKNILVIVIAIEVKIVATAEDLTDANERGGDDMNPSHKLSP